MGNLATLIIEGVNINVFYAVLGSGRILLREAHLDFEMPVVLLNRVNTVDRGTTPAIKLINSDFR